MNVRLLIIIIICFIAQSLHAQNGFHTQAGKIAIVANNKDNFDINKITLKLKNIAGEIYLYHANIYDNDEYKDVITGHFLLDNKLNKDVKILYQILFKDKVGLIAKTSGQIPLLKGKNTPLHFSNIPLSVKDIENIVSYEIKLILK